MGRTKNVRNYNAPRSVDDIYEGCPRGFLLANETLVDLAPGGVALERLVALDVLVKKIDEIIGKYEAHHTSIRFCIGVSGTSVDEEVAKELDRMDVATWMSGAGTCSNRWGVTYKEAKEGESGEYKYTGLVPITCVTSVCIPHGTYPPKFPPNPIRYTFDLEEDLVTTYGVMRGNGEGEKSLSSSSPVFQGSLPYARGVPPRATDTQSLTRVIYLVVGGDSKYPQKKTAKLEQLEVEKLAKKAKSPAKDKKSPKSLSDDLKSIKIGS